MKSSRFNRVIISYLIAITLAFVFALSTHAQNVVRKGNTFESVEKSQDSSTVIKTDYVYKDRTGEYPIYLSSKGNAFVFKISKKSGKKYRKYLPEITKQLGTKKDDANTKNNSREFYGEGLCYGNNVFPRFNFEAPLRS